MFCAVDINNYNTNNYFNYSRLSDSQPLISVVSLLLDGKHRYDYYLPEFIFRQFFPNNAYSVVPMKHQYLMPFAIRPSDTCQPSGSLNLSKFDTTTLNLIMNPGNPEVKLYIFGVVYNVHLIENNYMSFEWVTN